jgi:hypothetical protein
VELFLLPVERVGSGKLGEGHSLGLLGMPLLSLSNERQREKDREREREREKDRERQRDATPYNQLYKNKQLVYLLQRLTSGSFHTYGHIVLPRTPAATIIQLSKE